MNTKSQASISSLPDDVLALILSKTGKKARLRDVPLVCLAWRRIAEQLTTWETIDVNCLHKDGRLAANPLPGYLRWLRKQAAELKAIGFRLPKPKPNQVVWHQSLQMLYQQVLTSSLCLLSQPRPSTLSQLRSISYSADFEEGHLLCLMDHLVLFPELQSLRIDCKDTAEELFVDWTGLTNLHKLENLRIYIWGPGSGEVLPPEIYTLSALTQLAFCLAWVEGKPALKVSQLRSLRSLRIEEVHELEFGPGFAELISLEVLELVGQYNLDLSRCQTGLSQLTALTRVLLSGQDEDLHPDASLGVPEQLLLLAAVQALVLKYVGGDLCIGQLTSLTSLHLNQCPLWRFPTSVSLLTQLEVLHIDIIWPDKLRARPLLTLNSLQTLTVRCYDDSKVSRNIGDLQQLTSLRRVVFEDVGELEAVSQERLAALQARFVQQGRGGVIKLVIKRKSR